MVPLVRVEDLLGKGTAVLSWPAAGAAAAGSIDLGGIDITHGVVVYVFCCWVSWDPSAYTSHPVHNVICRDAMSRHCFCFRIVSDGWIVRTGVAHSVSFQWKNPDFLSRHPDFLLKNVEFII